MTVTIKAFLQAEPGKEEALRKELKKAIAPSQAEAGCLEYVLYESEAQDGVFIFSEKWKDEEAVQQHIQSEHYQAYRENTEGLVVSREVYKVKPAE
ncbi:quinol monooxygenase YgiN [Sinobaca qinghaiensis]|uniref:Quinol monooxygenase YgiN n=1 Tax=Sinobaca qinghaiensis TaxID=342944 RepID=A0A419V583_9BACL|nr:putative quinol monooxygenase [Sinobaca qinghaiensis]RKD75145.1 quinol monooxygenase YgiN [Sinobaca qinghaiensis]